MKRASTARCGSPQNSYDENEEYEGPLSKRSNPTRAKSSAVKYLTTFQAEWSKEWPCITKVPLLITTGVAFAKWKDLVTIKEERTLSDIWAWMGTVRRWRL